MTFTRLALIGGVVVLGLVCWLAAIGLQAATEGLVTVVTLVVLVAGGNWLAGRGTPRRAPVALPGSPGAADGSDVEGPAVGSAADPPDAAAGPAGGSDRQGA